MKRFLRILSLTLCLSLLLTILPPLKSWANTDSGTVTASGTCGDNLIWKLYSDGTLEISGNGSMYDYNYFDPWVDPWEDLSLRNVRSTSRPTREVPWHKSSIKRIVIGQGVTHIGSGAFQYCASVRAVYFCGDVPSIGHVAFDVGNNCVGIPVYYHDGAAGWVSGGSFITGDFTSFSIQKAAHICLEYTYDNNYTCTTDGTERAVCLSCGVLHIRKVEGTAAHRCSYVSNNDATCTADGTKTGKCVLCGAMDTVTDPGTAFGHVYADYVLNNDATCTKDGTQTGKCQYCDSTETVTAPGSATGHSFTSYISDNNATCTLDGTKTAKCDNCDATDIQVDTGSMAHRYIDGSCIYCGESGLISASLRGTVTVFAEGPVMLELLSDSGERTELSVSEGTYQLDCIVPGNYTLTVSQTGSVTRSYSLTLGEGENTLDLKLHLPGDVNGDGRYNIGDVARIYAHVKDSTRLTGYELLCADYTGDGRVNVGDTARVYYILKGY